MCDLADYWVSFPGPEILDTSGWGVGGRPPVSCTANDATNKELHPGEGPVGLSVLYYGGNTAANSVTALSAAQKN